MNTTLKGYIQLTRPANLPTAAADVLAGVVLAGATDLSNGSLWNPLIMNPSLFLIAASVCLYAGGVVLNDVFDYRLDAIERPERPIPSGAVSLRAASIFGGVLLVLGIFLAFCNNMLSGGIGLLLALSIVLYDAFSKKHGFLGPLNMGICRGLNLLMGMAVFGALTHWTYAIVPVVYIAAITLISRGEVHGGNKKHIVFAGLLYILVICTLFGFHYLNNGNLLQTIPYILLFGISIFGPLTKAYKNNTPHNIKKAVIAGVLSIVLLDAIMAVGFSNWKVGLFIVLLLPLSILLSKLFAVT